MEVYLPHVLIQSSTLLPRIMRMAVLDPCATGFCSPNKTPFTTQPTADAGAGSRKQAQGGGADWLAGWLPS